MNAEEIKPYRENDAKAPQVEEMFDNIAPAYDFMNTAMTFGMHHYWLRKALEASVRTRVSDIIDLATGTGDVAFRLAARYPEASITGVDLSEGMLRIASAKAKGKSEFSNVRFETGDCLNLRFPEGSFDLLTIAYGVRNFENLRKGFEEFYRVLRPKGSFMILELSRPENPIVKVAYDTYTRGVIPFLGRLISHDRHAYAYLPQSIAAMPPRRRIVEMLGEAGFKNISFKSLTFGVVTFYTGEK